MYQSKSDAESSATHYKIRNETLEELLHKQKVEHDQVFTTLQNKLQVGLISD